MKAYPLSLKTRISWMLPKGANVFVIRSSDRPAASPPQYTVQLVGLDWLYTSSKVRGLVFTATRESRAGRSGYGAPDGAKRLLLLFLSACEKGR